MITLKKALIRLTTLCIISCLILSFIFLFSPSVKADMPSDRFNIMWVGPITEFTITEQSVANLASTCLSNNISTVVFSVGSWIKYTGGYYTFPYALPESALTLQNICTWCHANGLVVGATLYSDLNTSRQFSIDVSTISNRNSEVSAVTTILSYGFDFYIDDTEGYTGQLSDIIAFWGNMSDAIHAVNKVSAVYYGMHAWPQGYIDDATVFNSFTSQDFIVARFHPGAATASTELSLIRDHLPCKWMTQVRVDEGQDNITSSAVFYNTAFSSGFDANFQGHSLWAWYLITNSDWTVWRNWTEKNFPFSGPYPTPSPTPKPTPVPTPSPFPTATPSPSPSPNPTPTHTPIPTPSPSSQQTPSPSALSTISPSPTSVPVTGFSNEAIYVIIGATIVTTSIVIVAIIINKKK
jgi:hypothetical protein